MNQHFENAKRIQQAYRVAVEEVRNDRTLSDQGKREKLAGVVKVAREKLAAEHEGYRAAVKQKRTELQKQAFALGYHPTATEADKEMIRMSFRDAVGRLQAIETPDTALTILETAAIVGDQQMTKAVGLVAFQRGWSKVLDQYNEVVPGKVPVMRELIELDAVQADPMTRLAVESTFSLSTPPDVSPADISAAPATQAAAG